MAWQQTAKASPEFFIVSHKFQLLLGNPQIYKSAGFYWTLVHPLLIQLYWESIRGHFEPPQPLLFVGRSRSSTPSLSRFARSLPYHRQLVQSSYPVLISATCTVCTYFYDIFQGLLTKMRSSAPVKAVSGMLDC